MTGDTVQRHARANGARPAAGAHGSSLLIISQVYEPDPAAVGQYIADLARELVRGGRRVIVCTARRGYDDPSVVYPAREIMDGVEIRRLPLSSFGKRTLLHRIVGTAAFIVQAFFISLTMRRVGAILYSTSPPLISFAAVIAARIRRIPSIYWVMDLNPDQLVALGHLRSRSPLAYALRAVNQIGLRSASRVIALDRFMAHRMLERGVAAERLTVVSPWSQDDNIQEESESSASELRRTLGLDRKLVVMYSGNHTPSNPLDTLLGAALALRDDDRFRFVFVGGGIAKPDVEEFARTHRLANIVSLPYQPLDRVSLTLACADVQVVTLGQDLVGIVHPCKIYNALAAARPVLFIGPRPSHVTDILDAHQIGWHADHGDTTRVLDILGGVARLPEAERRAMGTAARRLASAQYSQRLLREQLRDFVESAHLPDMAARQQAGHRNGRSNGVAAAAEEHRS